MTTEMLGFYSRWSVLAVQFSWQSFRRTGHLQKHYLKVEKPDIHHDDAAVFAELTSDQAWAVVQEMEMRYQIMDMLTRLNEIDPAGAQELGERLVAPKYHCKSKPGRLIIDQNLTAQAWAAEATNAISEPVQVADVWVILDQILAEDSAARLAENLTSLREAQA